MKEATIKTYVTYDAEEDKLEVLIKDRTKTFEILLSNKNGITPEVMRLQIGNWIMNEVEEIVEEAKKELQVLNGENTDVERK